MSGEKDTYKAQKEYHKRNPMPKVGADFKETFVLEFREALKIINENSSDSIKQSDIIRKAMKDIIAKANVIKNSSKVKDSQFKNTFIDLLTIVAKKQMVKNDRELQRLYCGIQLGGFMTPLKAVENLQQSFVILGIPMYRKEQLRFKELKEYAKWRDNINIFEINDINFDIMTINLKINY